MQLMITKLERRRLARTLAAMWLVWLPGMFGTQSQAQSAHKTPLPEFTGRRLTVSEVPDHYPDVVKKIEQLEKSARASFYVVVIRSSGRGENATRTYVDDLFRAWSKSSAGESARFDPERSVLIVVALDNRQLATHAGAELRRRYGLDGTTIRTEIVEPRFIPLAKEMKYQAAIEALLDGFQEKISGKPAAAAESGPHLDRGIVDSLSRVETPAPTKSRTTGRQLVWALAASLAVIVAIVFGLVWLGRRRINGTVARKLKGVKGQAVQAMDRIDALKERHKLLPASAPGFTQPMSGETLERYNAVKAKLDALWDRWLQVMDKIDKAQKLVGLGGDFGLSNQKSRQAEEILTKEVKFPEIEAEAQQCSDELDHLEKAHDETLAATHVLADLRAKLTTQLERVGRAGLPAVPYQSEEAAIEELGAEADTLAVADPIGSEAIIAKAKVRVEDQIERIGAVLTLLDQSRNVERSLKEVERATAAQRSKGFKLQEEEGNPDPLIVEGVRRHGLGLAALQAGDPKAAKAELADADARAKQAQQVLDAVVQAKAICRREGPARDRETARLRDAFGEAKNYRDELERDFAPASWQGVARNLDQAKALLDTFDRKSAEATDEGSDSKQNYRLGARLFEELGRQQQIALRLMAGLGEQVNTLVAIRQEVQELNRQLETADRKVATLLEENSEVVSPQAQGLFDSARRAAAEVTDKLADRRPDWPAIRDSLKGLLEEYGIAETRAEADLTAYQSFVAEVDKSKREASRVGAFLASHAEDRPAANRRFRSASASLEQLGAARSSNREWPRRLQIVRDASSDVQAAERMAREDIRLAAQAESEITEADATLQQARSAVGMGIVANTSDAEVKIRQARQLLEAQNYEQAISQAEAAFQSARSAYNAATQQIFYQQMQEDADRRRRYASEMARASYRGPSAGSIAAATAAASILGRMAEAAGWNGDQMASNDPGSSSEMPDEGTSVSSWESDSTQSGW
jgi:hypothetical protein